MKLKLSETQIQREILNYLKLKKICAFRMNTQGTFRKDKKSANGYRITPNNNKGFADILVLHDGRAIFLEVKSEKGKLSDDQRSFADLVAMQGCNYFVVRNIETVMLCLSSIGIKL